MFFIKDEPTITRTRGYSIIEPAAPGSTVTLLCVVDANPINLSNIKWFKNDKELSLMANGAQWERRIEGNEASLIGRSVQKEDAGQYTCEIENQYNNSRAAVPLVVQCKFVLFNLILF